MERLTLLAFACILLFGGLLMPRLASAVDPPYECSETPQPNKSKCAALVPTPWTYTILPALSQQGLGPFSSLEAALSAAEAVTASKMATNQWCSFSRDHYEDDGEEGVLYDNGFDVRHRDRIYYNVIQVTTTNPPCQQTSYAIGRPSRWRQVACPEMPPDEGTWRIIRDDNIAGEKKFYCACPWYSVCVVPCCELAVGNPIDVLSGAKITTESDYQASGPYPLHFERNYRSDRAHGLLLRVRNDFAPVGIGWSAPYFQRLQISESGGQSTVTAYRPTGQVRVFRRTAAGGYVAEKSDPDRVLPIIVSGSVTGWQYKTASEEVESYDVNGRLLSIASRAGITHTLTYSSTSDIYPASVADSFGHQIVLTYGQWTTVDGIPKLVSVTLPGGAQISYSYDANENITSVTYPGSTSRTYLYTSTDWLGVNLLTGIVDENGVQYSSFEYIGARGTKSEHAGGVDRYTLTYNGDGSRTVVDPLGTSRTFGSTIEWGTRRYASSNTLCQGCGYAKGTTYDADGNVASRTDFNNVQSVYSYDAARPLETSRTEASGTALARTTTTTWHPTYRLPATVTEPNRTTGWTYDSAGNVLTRTVTDTTVTPNVSRTWTYTYNSYGQVLTEDGPRTDVSDTTTYTYYSCSTGYQCGQLHTITTALSQVTTFNTYNAHGQPLTMTDPNGVVTTLTYDSRQRVTSRAVAGETTTFQYWPTGLLKKVVLPDASFVLNTYDSAHRLTKIEDGDGNRIQYTLDAMGNRTGESAYDPSSALARTRSQVFNSLNQLWKQLPAAGTVAVTTVFGYDNNGNQTSVNAPLSRNSTNQYDELNRLHQITDPGSGVTTFGYDVDDNLTSVTDPRGLLTGYVYNGFGELKTLSSPDTGTTQSTYDSGGNLRTKTDARSVTGTYNYDALNRLTSIVYPDTTMNFTYDSGTNGAGRMTGASDANHSMSWGYDAQGRVTSKTQTTGSTSRTVSYGYTDGNLTSMTTPSGQSVVFAYTSGRVSSVAINGVTLLNGVIYEPFGPIRQWSWGSGGSAIRTYDQDGKVSQIDSGGDFFEYDYDDAFRVTGITNSTPGSLSWDYGYDSRDRLTSFSTTGRDEAFTYDANGNRLTQSGTAPAAISNTLAISSTSNRLSFISGSRSNTYGYNNIGSVTSETNPARPVLLSSTTTTNYRYNALGQRIAKTVGALATHFVYDEAGHLLGEYTASGILIQETIWLGDIPVATLRPSVGGTVDVFYVHTDHLNAPRKVTRASDGVLMWRWDPAPFGDTRPSENPESAGTFRYNVRFPGQYYDAESGLSYNYARDFDTVTGRYIESDPVGIKAGVNTYAYVLDNPVSYNDPTGLEAEDPYSHVQCDGKGDYEIINRNNNKCTSACTQAHEASHVADVKQEFGAGACRNKPRGYNPSKFPGYTWTFVWQSECKAYQTEQTCLEALLKDCKCKKDAKAALSGINRQVRYYCGTRPPFP